MAGNHIRTVKTENDIIISWRRSILTKFITKIYVETPLHFLYTKQSICCMCVRVEHFYKIYEEYSFKQKTLLSCQIWWQEENFASLWFSLLLMFQLVGLGLAHGYIHPILIYSVCISDMEDIPCYTVVMTQLFY